MVGEFSIILALSVVQGSTPAAVTPMEKPSMSVQVSAGQYTIAGKKVTISSDAVLPIDLPEKITVKSEEQVLEPKPEQYYGYVGANVLRKTYGPIDQSRLPDVIDPASVKVYSEPGSGTLYKDGVDYTLDPEWGGIWRIDGSIPADAKVYVDYSVYLQRIDSVLLSKDGILYVKKGKSASISPEIPVQDKGSIRIANVYVPFRTSAITESNIYPLPAKKRVWQDFMKVSGKENLKNTLAMLKAGKHVNVVCWGDSVTQGGSPTSHDLCYVERFRKNLKEAYPQADINLINAGIGGSNTESRKAGFETEVLAYNPDLITVEFINDVGLGTDWIKKNWTDFVAKARQKNPKVEFIFITPHHVKPSWMGQYFNSVQAMRDSAADHGAALADCANIWANLRSVGLPYETLLANGINHPDNLGHQFFYDSLMKLLAPSKK
ncbi:MAG: SGNH/GDSL hydrolase family protein [Armatimonadota bacterium]